MRYRQLPQNWYDFIHVSDQLVPVQEKNNEYDRYAIKLYAPNNLWLEYIPGIYAQAITALIERGIDLKITVEEKRPKHAPRWWLRVRLEAVLDLDEGHSFHVAKLEDLVMPVAS